MKKAALAKKKEKKRSNKVKKRINYRILCILLLAIKKLIKAF